MPRVRRRAAGRCPIWTSCARTRRPVSCWDCAMRRRAGGWGSFWRRVPRRTWTAFWRRPGAWRVGSRRPSSRRRMGRTFTPAGWRCGRFKGSSSSPVPPTGSSVGCSAGRNGRGMAGPRPPLIPASPLPCSGSWLTPSPHAIAVTSPPDQPKAQTHIQTSREGDVPGGGPAVPAPSGLLRPV